MAIYNRYFGNTGRVQKMQEKPRQVQPSPPHRASGENPPHAAQRRTEHAAQKPEAKRQPPEKPKQSLQPARRTPAPPMFLPQTACGRNRQPAAFPNRGKPGGLLGGLASRLDLSKLETEDLILLLILYLLYRESGDEELLIMMGAMFLL